jgi:peroxiredoxin
VLAVGDQIPDAQVWLAPREPISLRELVEEGPVLIVFYLFDWSGT